MIIGIVGKAGHGKDTLADMIIDEYSIEYTIVGHPIKRKEGYNPFEKARFADGLKKACAAITGYPNSVFYDRDSYFHSIPALEMTVREMMQKVGEGLRETVHPDIWINTALMRCRATGNYLFCDVRYPNEIERIKEVGGKIIHIVRPEFEDKTLQSEESKRHSSETALDSYEIKPDDFILNESLETLREYVRVFLIKNILEWERNSKLDKQYPKEETSQGTIGF